MRKRRVGATLALSVVCLLIIVLLGIFVLVVVKVMGGGREIAHATDSGILAAAKRALRTPSVDVNALGTPEFKGLGEGNSDSISLITYNRAVALMMLVALNADEENTAQARQNALLLHEQLKKLGTRLSSDIKSGILDGAFDEFAQANSVKMLGFNSITQRQRSLESGFMKPGGNTNVYINPASISPALDLTKYLNTQSIVKSSTGQFYISGYRPLSVAGLTLFGVPVFPQSSPHLIRTGDFLDAKSLPGAGAALPSIPPNSFMAASQAKEQLSGSMAGAVACAIVGCLDRQYDARIPYGHIRLVNGPGHKITEGFGPITSDGSNDLFNKELFSPSKVTMSDNKVFSTDIAQMEAWVSYNNSTGSDEHGRDPPSILHHLGTIKAKCAMERWSEA